MRIAFAVVAAIAALSSMTAEAKDVQAVRSLEVTSRGPAFGGAAFGDRGAYEEIKGVAHMQIDPRAAANRDIVDLDHAPRDAQGLVQYDVDFVILRPQHAAQARRVLVFDVVNRGLRTIQMFNNVGIGGHLDDPGDGFLMRQGYTLVAIGWQPDVPPAMAGMLHARFPVATNGAEPITGRVTTETIFDDPATGAMTLPYRVASMTQTGAELEVRQNTGDPAQAIAPGHWRFVDDRHISIDRPANMDAGAIYSFSYVARDPWVMGLAFAATRDFVTFLRHAQTDASGAANPVADIASAPCEHNAQGACANTAGGAYDAAIAFGASQSGRYIRDFLYQDFNRDLAGWRVFDGVLPTIPGARRTFTNLRFAEPGRFSRQHEDHGVPGFDFPFTYATMRDGVTGRSDGILQRCSASGTCPKIFHIDTSGEFWQAGASLISSGGGDADVALPDNVRAYLIAGGAHAPGFQLPTCANPTNPLNYIPIWRALLADMVDWTLERAEPPPSQWPRLGDLSTVEGLQSPDLSSVGVHWPRVVNRPEPPAGRPAWPVLVPKVDDDGVDVAGIHMPQVAAPTGTYLGWNLRKPGFAPGELCIVVGSFIPFAADAHSRGADPRLSVAERYPSANDRAARLAQQAESLLRERFLLGEDADALKHAAAGDPLGMH